MPAYRLSGTTRTMVSMRHRLRKTAVIFVMAALLCGIPGPLSFAPVQRAQAASDFSIQTGYYLGTGTARSIRGLGFRPEVVIVKADTAAGQLVWKSSVMADNVSAYLGVATADNTETEITIDADGFTVSPAAEVNTIGVTYTFIAYAGSDCSAAGAMCVGVYTGDGAASQDVVTGFQPDLVWVKRSTALVGAFRTSAMPDNTAAYFSAAVHNTTGVLFKTLNSDGFTVGLTHNTAASSFYYVAFRNLPNKLAVGSFLGNGVDNRNITGLAFEPDFVLVKQDSAVVPAFNTTEMYGDYSSVTTAAASAVNHIQSLDANGFQVGNSTSVNANGIVSHYFAFGGSPDPTPAGNFTLHRGSYVGTGEATEIETPFAPSLVIIKGNTNQYAVWSTSLEGDATEYFAVAGAAFVGGITGMSQTGFRIGSHASVNTESVTYEFTVFGNATSPRKGDGASDFYIGTYSGNGIDNRVIDHLGFAPSMVVVKRSNGSANQSFWKASDPVMADGTSAYFSATADVAGGVIIKTLTSDGFIMGNNAGVNAAGATYVWFAFKESAYFDIGSYAGDSQADREITGIGFAPDFMWTKRDSAIAAVHRSSSLTIAADESQHFLNLSNDTNDIKSFTADGFILGNSAEVNTTGGTYRYAAWRSALSNTPPDRPINALPASGAIEQDLQTVLAASAYVDSDNNPQMNAEWQVDDDADFSSPVWTRMAGVGETTTAITAGNGTFANELSGKTGLDHGATYFWRTRYADSLYSLWSAPTAFTTHVIGIPSPLSPADGSTVTTLTPTLTASAFADPQAGHMPLSARWQIARTNDFSQPVHDSGIVAYGTSHAVPGAMLADRTVYHWRVQYGDADGQWSAWSASARFLVSKANITVKPIFGGTVVDPEDAVHIDAQVFRSDGSIIEDAAVTVNVFTPAGAHIVIDQAMTYLTGSNGVYRYSYVIPASQGSYLYEVTAAESGETGYGAANFEVRTIRTNVSAIAVGLTAHEAAQATERDNQETERVAQEAERVAQEESRAIVEAVDLRTTDMQTSVQNLQSNMDILIGAMIVTQSSVQDAAATQTSFVSGLSNATDDFYKNAVLTFTSGALDGQSRRIAAYDGTTKTVTLDPALTSAPADGDTFTIVAQNVRVEEQVAAHETAQASFRSDTTARLTSIETKMDGLTATLNTVDTNLDALQMTIDDIRSSQILEHTVTLSDVEQVETGATYRALLTLLDYQSHPVDAAALPSVMLFDPTRAVAQAAVPMVRLSTGAYEFTFPLDTTSAVSGLWETVVTVNTGGAEDIVRNDYWRVSGAPAQVFINALSDVTVPTIAAQVTITNEGTSEYEYAYEWCVVSAQDNPCGGEDDVYFGSAAKLIAPGENFRPTLTATVPSPGDYWFKMTVHFGSEASAASRSFTAVTEEVPVEEEEERQEDGAAGGASPGAARGRGASDLPAVGDDLDSNAQQLAHTLEMLEFTSPALRQLLEISADHTDRLIDIQNKIADLRAVSATTRRMIEQRSVEPIVETYMKFNSVEIHFLITNPDVNAQTVKFRAFLPEEARPEHIADVSGLRVEYDANAKVYFVSGDITLGPRESVTKKVEMEDIWVFSDENIHAMKQQVAALYAVLDESQYAMQGVLLKNDIDATLGIVLLRQKESYASPQQHIVVYRENRERMVQTERNLEKLADLVAQASASQSVVGSISGIQTFATWGIIVAIVSGFGMLAAVIFAMWRHQTMFAAAVLGMTKKEAAAYFGKQVSDRRKQTRTQKARRRRNVVKNSPR